MPRKDPCPRTGKKRFRTAAPAEGYLFSMKLYRCKFCGDLHLTKRKKYRAVAD